MYQPGHQFSPLFSLVKKVPFLRNALEFLRLASVELPLLCALQDCVTITVIHTTTKTHVTILQLPCKSTTALRGK